MRSSFEDVTPHVFRFEDVTPQKIKELHSIKEDTVKCPEVIKRSTRFQLQFNFI